VHARDDEYQTSQVLTRKKESDTNKAQKIVPVALTQEDADNLTYVFKASEE
jgi:hypothetical protein